MVVDLKQKIITINAVVRDDVIRSDNQWWQLVPGVNAIQYNRTDSPGTAATMAITYRSAWSSA